MSRLWKPNNPIIIIQIDKTGFTCSRELISRYSRHLKEIAYAEEPPDSVGFGDISSNDFYEYNNWVMKGRRYSYLTLHNIVNLINFAVAFECDTLRDQCRKFVNSHCRERILYELLELVRFPGREGLMSHYVHETFDLLRYATDMMGLQIKALTDLFRKDDLMTDSEQNVVDTGIRWLTFAFKSLLENKQQGDGSNSISTISNVSEYFEEMSDRQADSEDEVDQGNDQRGPGLRTGDSGLQISDVSTDASLPNGSGSSDTIHIQDIQGNAEQNYEIVLDNFPAIYGANADASAAQNDFQSDSSNTFTGRHGFVDRFPEAKSTVGGGNGNDDNHGNRARYEEVDSCESDSSESDNSLRDVNGRPRRRGRGRGKNKPKTSSKGKKNVKVVVWSEDSEDDTCSSDGFEFEDEELKEVKEHGSNHGTEDTTESNAAASNHGQNQPEGMNGEDSVGNEDPGVGGVQRLLQMRKKHVFDVLAATRLCHCTEDYVSSLTEMLIIRTCPEAWALVQEAVRYLILKDRRHDYVPATAVARRSSKLQNVTVSVLKGTPLTILLTDYVEKESYRVKSTFRTKNSEFRLVCYDDAVYITGATCSRRVWKYDSRRGRWSECPRMRVPRRKHALICHGGYMYAIGGDALLTVERLHVELDANGNFGSPLRWEMVGKLKRTLKRIVTVTVLNDFILVFAKVAGFPQCTCIQYFSTETRSVVLRQKFFVPAKGLISFRKADQAYILERSGAVWRLCLDEGPEPCFKLVCNLWRKKIHLKGAFFVGKTLHVFVGAKSSDAAPKINVQQVEGFCEGVSLSFHVSEYHTPLLMERKLLDKKKKTWAKETVLVSYAGEKL